MAIIELAATSSSSVASSGSRLAWAGSKNWPTTPDSNSSTYSQAMLCGSRNGMRKISTARSPSAINMIRLRSIRSTRTPATSPTRTLGAADAMSISPTLSADPVSL